MPGLPLFFAEPTFVVPIFTPPAPGLFTHGFVFADHHTKVTDFTDESERKRVYDPEVAVLIKKHSGASDVVVFDHTIRVGDEKVQQSTGARPPVKGVHNDYTENSAPVRLREIVGDAEAERRLKSAGRSSSVGGRSAAKC